MAAPARAEAPVLTVTADRAASARFHLASDTLLSYDRAAVVTTASYAGLALYGDDGTPYGGLLTAPAARATGVDTDAVYLAKRSGVLLPKGWYRVVVLTDGRAEVRIPLDRGAATTVHATTPDRQTFQAFRQPLAAQQAVVAEVRAPLPRTTAGQRGVLLARVEPGYVQDGYSLLTCATHRGKACGRRDTRSELRGTASTVGGARVLLAGFSVPGRQLSGTRDAYARATLTPTAPASFTFLFVHWTEPAHRVRRS